MAELLSIITCLWPWCVPRIEDSCPRQEKVRILSVAMDELKEARDDLRRRVREAEADPIEPKKRIEEVDGWLKRVQNIEGEVEKIMQKVDELQINRGRCLGGYCPPNNCWSSYKLGKSIAEKIQSVKQLKDEGHFEDVAYRLPPPSVKYMNLRSTVGMESMFDKVWRLITRKDDKVVRIMGLYGQGGVGKTHLLGKINNEFSKISEYDHVLYVVVSKPVNYEAIQTKIGERLGLSKSLQGDEEESSRAEKIFNKLNNRRFVLMLDDIWERVDLKRIGVPIPPQGNSSKVIFTTRYKEVCGTMDATHKFQVECLPKDKAWTLFENKVGNESLSSHPGIRELAVLVAEECGGLPLALIIIGRAMSTRKSVEEWKDALITLRNSTSEFPGMTEEVFPRLKLSYDSLGNDTIKSCFLYCAIFPEDYPIWETQLIDYYIGEGFINGFDNLDEARINGNDVIQTLKRACLLESSSYSNVKMHDIIRDLALWIVNDCKSSSSSSRKMDKFLVESNNITCEKWENAERIFWMVPRDGICYELEKPPASPNLLTLIVDRTFYKSGPFFSLPQSFFQFTSSLGVLDLSSIKLTKLPISICELSELHYLSLKMTHIRELPFELRKLVKLKFLDLSYTSELRKIPQGVIANLSELRFLSLCGSEFGAWGLKEEDGGLNFHELDRLKQLQDVTLSIHTSLALEKLLCNQKLLMICTKLNLRGCIKIKSVSLPPPSLSSSSTIISEGLGKLTNLEALEIKDSLELEELILFINDDREINARWHNNNKLEYLYLYGIPRLNNIVWEKYDHLMAAQQQHFLHVSPFQNLSSIYISGCNALKNVTWVVYVENLKTLHLSSCKELQTIIELGDDGLEGTAGGGGEVFGKLTDIDMDNLPKLKCICRHALALPSIEIIDILECPELKKLPLDSGSNANDTLTSIKASTSWWNELQWEDETTKSKFLPYHNDNSQWVSELSDWDDSDYGFEDLENSGDVEEWEDSDDDVEAQANSDDVEDQARDETSFSIEVQYRTFHRGI